MNDKSIDFGAPGTEPRWTSSAKDGIGTANPSSSRVWFALSHGIVNEIYFPHVLEPMELAHLPYKKGRTYEDDVGLAGLERLGKKKWRRHVRDVVKLLKTALEADYVVIGGGIARLLKTLPAGSRLGDKANAFHGGSRIWTKSSSQADS